MIKYCFSCFRTCRFENNSRIVNDKSGRGGWRDAMYNLEGGLIK